MTLPIPASLALAILTRMVRLSDRRRQIRCETDFDEIVEILVEHNVWTVLPDNPQTLH
jgi:hypothetical protein